MEKLKKIVNNFVDFLALFSIYLSPFIVLLSSILSTIDFYLVGHSVIAGVAGFFIGGLLASITMTAFVILLGWIGYYTESK